MKKKIASVCLVIALMAIAVMGTLAYFTDEKEAKNTFTVGKKVKIELTEDVEVPEEHKDDPDWKGGTKTNEGADYGDIVPGINYAKKAAITVKEDGMPIYAFAEISMTHMYFLTDAAGIDMQHLDQFFVNSQLGSNVIDYWMDEDGTFHIVFAKGAMEPGDSWTLFEAVKLPETTTTEDLEAAMATYDISAGEIFSLNVKAYAIQKDGFDSEMDAWTTGFGKTLHSSGN